MSGDHNENQNDSSFLDKPEAIRLADIIDAEIGRSTRVTRELRRLHLVNQELVEALEEIAEWTDRYTTPGHPISNVARAAIAKAKGESNE